MKLLYDIAAIYGFDVRDYKERLYILHIIQLAFSIVYVEPLHQSYNCPYKPPLLKFIIPLLQLFILSQHLKYIFISQEIDIYFYIINFFQKIKP